MGKSKPIFLKIKGGWISPSAIKWAETHSLNEKMLLIGLDGKSQPIPLDETDSAYMKRYLDSRTWGKAADAPPTEDSKK